jgi:3-hydroxyacyl-[acyl-carrier-protein] dehydratase
VRFFLVDRVLELVPGERIRGVKCVTLTDEVLHDHFPDHPMLPGTLIVEALAQLGGYLVEESNPGQGRAVLAQIEQARFHLPVGPGDRLDLSCGLLSQLEGAAQVEGEARLEGQKAATARLTFVLRKVESEKVHRQRDDLYRIWRR